MAAKTRKNFWGLENGPLLTRYLGVKAPKGDRTAEVAIVMEKKTKGVVRVLEDESGARLTVAPLAGPEIEKDVALKATVETKVRDAMGPLISHLEKLEVTSATINFTGPAQLLTSVVAGLELALYRYRRVLNADLPKFQLNLLLRGRAVSSAQLAEGLHLGQAVNVARHLTNLPPNFLNPETYAAFAKGFLAGRKGVKVEIWDEKRLRAENMGLHLAVGLGAAHPSRLVRIRYTGAAKKPAVALVGKGITFDSGGLDIKPSAGMRLMKKDMGGSAAVFGALLWAAMTKAKVNLDGYLALSENSIDAHSFRPSDVLIARNGLTVEIHNTDAEGRLVLADALDVAVTQKPAPSAVIDVATLTGAIKVGLGAQLAGLFANDRRLSQSLHRAGQASGDMNWPMPLLQKYRSQMNSNFADMINSPDGFGGAITAALFLEKFVGEVPWAHLDIYAWKDGADGALLEAGGSGQGVLALAQWLK